MKRRKTLLMKIFGRKVVVHDIAYGKDKSATVVYYLYKKKIYVISVKHY